ncbi:Lon protease family protein [Hyphomicrobium sp.]|uniref:Lon protease family protein n=1 Tax=Hyphomicrobium sp. TaxID=82 RepID=UPI002E2F1CE1|nr:AAA family ATPase [Hyphomicrobium sp.]HEX2840931.1 AAA family ATPase [Hyphomicrobium sp.]
MFFKRLTKNKSAPKSPHTADAETRSEQKSSSSASTSGAQALSPAELRRTVDPTSLGFKTTDNLDPATSPIGQDRALKAINFGLSMKARDFNVFVVGPPGTGKSTVVRSHLAKVAAASQTPPDWVYVTNFDDPRRPRALALPPGRGRALSQSLLEALREVAATLPAAFQSGDYQARRRAIEEEFRASQDDALETIRIKAAQQNIAVLRTPLGYGMAPMHDGKVVKPDVFNQLPESMRRDVETRVSALQTELETILASGPKADKERRRQLAELNQDVSRHAIEEALDAVSSAFADLPDIAAFLAGVEQHLTATCEQFLDTPANGRAVTSFDPAQDARLRRYLVNVVVSRDDEKSGAPVIDLANPTLANLVGHIDPLTPSTGSPGSGSAGDVLIIRPGALHRANGGALLMEARQLSAVPAAWEALKRALKSGEIVVEGLDGPGPGAVATQPVAPEPIPLLVKIVLFGQAEHFSELEQTDPDFSRLFKVQADFDTTVARSKDNDEAFGQFVASMVATHDLKPVEASGVARLMEEAARMAEDRDKLSIEAGRISDILREADYWSDSADRKATTADDILRAIKERTRRADRSREHIQESVERGIVLVDTDGKKIGQINALSLIQKGAFSFGRPARITARVHLGQGRVTDIEREVKLGGPLHSKGVMILWGYLAGRFAQEIPLALAATLVFEQSYDTVEGDSASAAELFALLSALADAPLRQELAVTGSVNQWGDVQAIGGVNEKIEGFFDVCAARGLTGTQGVVIPEANRQHLMLREDIVDAVREGRFTIYSIKTVDDGIALLTGLEAGTKGDDGRFGTESVNGRVAAKLKAYADRSRTFALSRDGAGA